MMLTLGDLSFRCFFFCRRCNEYTRNCNRLIINKLIEYGYNNLSGININVSREELKKRLLSASVEAEKVKKIIRGGVL